MLKIDYDNDTRKAIISWEGDGPWPLFRRVIEDHTGDITIQGANCITVPWWSFLSCRRDFSEIVISYGVPVHFSEKASELLNRSLKNDDSYKFAINSTNLSETEILDKLRSEGLARELQDHQIRNIKKLCSLPSAATFSVPGAGKTTEALCFYFYKRTSNESLLVISPKNAFVAWDEQLSACFPDRPERFVRLTGGTDKISALLKQNPPLMLITYQQLPRVRDIIADYISNYPSYVFLDESHRIKSGKQRQTAEAVLSLSHLPAGKLILSGTPMPQDIADLVPQFAFLYPEVPVSSDDVIRKIRPIYVRTTKSELRLPEVERRLIQLNMSPIQHHLYMLMRSETARLAEDALSRRSKQAFRSLGRSIMRLLKLVSNPALLASEIGIAHHEYVSALFAEGDSPKLNYVCNRARELARQGRKVLIWSTFVENVELVSSRLSDLGALYIHGKVDTGDEDELDTREWKIKTFHDDPNTWVLVANPAAASEGISLHTVCHNAIYLDRTFNAAHYLQSEDRIHRLGIKEFETPIIEIVECRDSVDEAVRNRLGIKVSRMAEALGDDSLRVDPIPYDPFDIEDAEDFMVGLAVDDIKAVLDNLRGDPIQ